MNKVINLIKNVFWYIIRRTCTVLLFMLKYVPGAQEAYDEALKNMSYENVPRWITWYADPKKCINKRRGCWNLVKKMLQLKTFIDKDK